MADNVTADSGTGGAVFATDDIGGVHYPITKLTFGALDSQTIASSGNGATDAGTQRVTISSDTTGVLSVDDNGGALTVDNGGTFAVQVDGAALTALQLIDNPVQVLGTDTYTEATSSGMTIGAVRRDADTTLVNTTNEFGPLQMDANGRLKVEAFSGETLPVSLTSTTVTGTVAVTQSGTWDEVGINDSGNSITTDWNGTAPPIGAGLEATALRVTLATDSTGVVSVDDNGGALTVDNAGTFAVQVDGNALTALQLIDNNMIAHDAVISGASATSIIGARAIASVETQTEVAAADVTYVNATLSGNQIVSNYCAPEEIVRYHVSNTAGTEIAVTGLDAGGAGIFNYVTSVIIHNAHATTMGFVQLLDGSAGAAIATFPAPATGGTAISFPVPLKQTTANTALYFDVSAAITTIYITIIGFQGQG